MKRHITGFLVLAALGAAPFSAGIAWPEEQIGAPAPGGSASGPQTPCAQAPGAQAPGVQASGPQVPGGQGPGPSAGNAPGGNAPGGPAAAPGGVQSDDVQQQPGTSAGVQVEGGTVEQAVAVVPGASALIAAGIGRQTSVLGNGIGPGRIPSPEFFPGGKWSCHHVINLLVRSSMFSRAGIQSNAPPSWSEVRWVAGTHGHRPVVVEHALGDMELLNIDMISDAVPEHGPVYQVTFRNNSRNHVKRFRVSVVAVLGEISSMSPATTVNVPELAAGATGTIQVELPACCMTMGIAGHLAPFDTVVVAIDSFDELIESNELNNIATLKRGEIGLLVVAAPADQAVEAPADGTAPGPAVQAPGASAQVVVPGQGALANGGPGGGNVPASPNINAGPAPNDPARPRPNGNVDLDSLDLDSAEDSAFNIE